MSLENEIKELRASIITLTEVIANMQNVTPTVQQCSVAEQEREIQKSETEQAPFYWVHQESESCGICETVSERDAMVKGDQAVDWVDQHTFDNFDAMGGVPRKSIPVAKTHEDLKATCLKVARAGDGNKAKVKAVLADYYAVKASDVPADKIAEVIEKVEAI